MVMHWPDWPYLMEWFVKEENVYRDDEKTFFHVFPDLLLFNSVTHKVNNTKYGEIPVSLRIQSERGKIRTRKTPNTETFHTVFTLIFCKRVESGPQSSKLLLFQGLQWPELLNGCLVVCLVVWYGFFINVYR